MEVVTPCHHLPLLGVQPLPQRLPDLVTKAGHQPDDQRHRHDAAQQRTQRHPAQRGHCCALFMRLTYASTIVLIVDISSLG